MAPLLSLAAGASEGLDNLLARLMLEAKFEEDKRSTLATEDYRNRSLEESAETRRLQQQSLDESRKATEASRLRDDARATVQALPKGSIVSPETYQGLTGAGVAPEFFLREASGADRGAMAEGVPESLAPNNLDPAVQSVMRFTGTAQQQEAEENRKRLDLQAEEQRNLQRELADERADRGWAPLPVHQPGGLFRTSPDRSSLMPITVGGEQAPLPPTTDTRNRSAAMQRVQPLLDAINELSPIINTKPGIEAIFQGGWNQIQAAANYDDDVAEYVAVVKGFTPLLARAQGHVGVLTEKDFEHAMEILPKPRDSASLAQRKIRRLETILGGAQAATGAGGIPPATPPAGASGRVDLYQEYLNRTSGAQR